MSMIYRISVRDVHSIRVPDRVRTITYARSFTSATRAAARMERAIASPTSCVIDVEIQTRAAGLGAAEWERVATLGARHPGSWDEPFRDVPSPATDAMERNGDIYVAYEGPIT